MLRPSIGAMEALLVKHHMSGDSNRVRGMSAARGRCKAEHFESLQDGRHLGWVFSRTIDYMTYGDSQSARSKLNTYAPPMPLSFLMTPKVLSKLLDSPSLRICELNPLKAPIPLVT